MSALAFAILISYLFWDNPSQLNQSRALELQPVGLDLKSQTQEMAHETASNGDFGLPFTLSEAEEEAVRELHKAAVTKGLKVYSVFELAEIVIVSNLNHKEAVKRLKNMRKLEEKYGFNELTAKVSVEEINALGEHPGLWASIFAGDEDRDVLFIDPTTTDFNLYAKGDAFRQFMHSVVVTSLAMNCDLTRVRRGITFTCKCYPFHGNHVNFGVARKYGHAAVGVVPLKIKKIFFTDVSTPARVMIKFTRGLLAVLNPKLAKRINLTKLEKLKDVFPLDALPKAYGGNAETSHILKVLEDRFRRRAQAHAEVKCPGVDLSFAAASPSEWRIVHS